MAKEIEIPEGYEARIEGNKVILEQKESEDERIRKWIIHDIQKAIDDEIYNSESIDDAHKALAWLEKQKIPKGSPTPDLTTMLVPNGYNEQKPAEKQDYSGLNDLERVIHRGFLCAGVENVPVGIIKETAQECLAQIKPAEWSEEDTLKLNGIINYLSFSNSPEGFEKWIDFLNSLPQRFNLQPKQEWGEEDEYCRNQLIVFCENCMQQDSAAIRCANWLKSLRPQPHWKPSENQMRCLLDCVSKAKEIHNASVGGYDAYRILMSLYDELHKLL